MIPLSFSMTALTQDLQRRSTGLRQSLSHHMTALSTGQAPAPQRHLQGDMAPLAAIEHRSARLQAEQRSLLQAETRLQMVQDSLESLRSRRTALSAHLRQASMAWSLPGSDAIAAQAAVGALQDMVSVLNQPAAGQQLFSGANADAPPLPPAQVILTAARDAVAGLASASDVVAVLEAFFLAPAGGFETQIHAGGAPVPGSAATGLPLSDLPTAAEPALREQLLGITLAALLATDSQVVDPAERRALADAAADRLDRALEPMTTLSARVGRDQAETAAQLARLGGEATALAQSRETLIGIDPFEAATRLEDTRVALETLYAVTARISRLSFAEYMR